MRWLIRDRVPRHAVFGGFISVSGGGWLLLCKELIVAKDSLPHTSAAHTILIIIMYIYHALISALSTHMIHINLNMIFCTHVEHSPTKTIYIKYYTEKQTNTCTTYTYTHTHTPTVAKTGY